MEIISGGVTAPKGFRAGGVHAGVRKNKLKKDMALLVSDVPAVTVGTYTLNVVKAAPVMWDRSLTDGKKKCQALVVNSGVANTCTGDAGYHDVVETAEYLGRKLNIDRESIAVASTGVIGLRLPMDTIKHGIDMLVTDYDYDIAHGTDASHAIMTTDLYNKEIAVKVKIKGRDITIGGMCKGSGMINPNLGTVLSFITTDLNVEYDLLHRLLKEDVDETYNMVSVDGDMSTNDTVMIFANGMAGNPVLTEADTEDVKVFAEALKYINTYFAKAIAADGEGATRMFQVDVVNAPNLINARKLAKAIVCSNLIKCAIYGSDANWGRFISAMGQSGAHFDPYRTDLHIASSVGELLIVKNGMATEYDEEYATRILSEKSVTCTVDLKLGKAKATAWGCDLTYDYIKINAEYRK